MKELPLHKGDFVRIDGINAVVVCNEDDDNIPAEHVGVFFGSGLARRESEGGTGNLNPQIWIIPIDLCEDGLEPLFLDA